VGLLMGLHENIRDLRAQESHRLSTLPWLSPYPISNVRHVVRFGNCNYDRQFYIHHGAILKPKILGIMSDYGGDNDEP
jgi:hypothetical protein